MKLTLLYISKNEENNIKKSILSCKDFVDNIILVDTGSTDNTTQIAKENGAKIFNYVWENDFATARNYALNIAKKEGADWVLFLDCDQYFSTPLTHKERVEWEEQLSSTPDCEKFFLSCCDIEKDTNKIIGFSCFSNFIKLIPSGKFVGKIHETFEKENGDFISIFLTDKKFEITHTGYDSHISLDKVKRNLEILKTIPVDKRKMSDYFYLGRENFFLKNFEEAKKYFTVFFANEEYKKLIKTSNIFYLGFYFFYHCLIALGEKDSSLSLLKKMEKEIGHIPETNYLLGKYWFNYDLKKSQDFFKKAISLNKNMEPFYANNFPSFESDIYFSLARIEEMRGNKQAAFNKASVACLLDNRNNIYHSYIISLLDRNDSNKNIGLIAGIIKPKTQEDYEELLRVLSYTSLLKEFVYFALEYNHRFQVFSEEVVYAVLTTQDYQPIDEMIVHFQSKKETLDILSLVIMLYDNSNHTKKYCKFLSSSGKKVYEYFISEGKNKLTTFEEKEIFIKVLIRLTGLGIEDYAEVFLFDFVNWSNEEQFKMLYNILSNKQKFGTAIMLSEIAVKLNKSLYPYLILALYKNRLYTRFIEEFAIYIKQTNINELKYVSLLNEEIPSLNSKYKALKNKLLKEVKYA